MRIRTEGWPQKATHVQRIQVKTYILLNSEEDLIWKNG